MRHSYRLSVRSLNDLNKRIDKQVRRYMRRNHILTIMDQVTCKTMGISDHMALLAHPDVMDQIIAWKIAWHCRGDIERTDALVRMLATHQPGESKMQRQYTIELRVNYDDKGKNEAMRRACTAAARHMYATAVLIADGVKPQIAVFSDDFFSGHERIALLDDTVQRGLDVTGVVTNEAADPSVSSELMDALKS